jgi:hypothetical protein
MQDGSTKIVLVSATTQITKSATGTQADLKTGENVVVTGTPNSDGSLTATNVQLGGGRMFFAHYHPPNAVKNPLNGPLLTKLAPRYIIER